LELTTSSFAGDAMVHVFMYRYNIASIDRNGNANLQEKWRVIFILFYFNFQYNAFLINNE